jgi:uncharacterized protein YggE
MRSRALVQMHPRPRTVGLALLVSLTTVAIGCGGSKPTVNVSTPSALSSSGVDAGITVTGSGDVSGKPDTLTTQFGILAKQPSVSAAVAGAAGVATTVINTLEAKGVAETDIQTQNYSVSPSFATVNGRQVPNGYLVGETLSVKLHDIPNAGGVIDAVTQATGNAVSVQGVSFTLEDNKQLLAQAREEAWKDAQAQAKQLSQLSGRHLGVTEGINETTNPTAFAARASAFDQSAASVTNLEPGQVSTTVSINVRFALS